MRRIINSTTIGLLTLVIFCETASGQDHSITPTKGKGNRIESILSAKQKEMLKQRAVKRQEFRQAFRATISQGQKDILGDPRIMPQERQKAFRASLTDQQVNMIKAKRKEMKKMREEFRATLTPDQKAAFRKMNIARKMKTERRFSYRVQPGSIHS